MNKNIKNVEHHKQLELCATRPAYRQGRKLTAVKVYTVNSESQHLFIYGVPSINLRSELKSLCNKHGKILNIHIVQDYETERFTECYHVHFERIQSARIAKRVLDNKSFYGGVLHVCYTPEYETVNETRDKLFQRLKDVRNRFAMNDRIHISNNTSNVEIEKFITITKSQIRKRRREGTLLNEEESTCSKSIKVDDFSG